MYLAYFIQNTIISLTQFQILSNVTSKLEPNRTDNLSMPAVNCIIYFPFLPRFRNEYFMRRKKVLSQLFCSFFFFFFSFYPHEAKVYSYLLFFIRAEMNSDASIIYICIMQVSDLFISFCFGSK